MARKTVRITLVLLIVAVMFAASPSAGMAAQQWNQIKLPGTASPDTVPVIGVSPTDPADHTILNARLAAARPFDCGYILPSSIELSAVAYGNGTYVVSGDYGMSPSSEIYDSAVLTSPDGATWTWPSVFNNMIIDDIAYGNGLFVAVCNVRGRGTSGAVLTSSDGVNWKQNNLDVAFNNLVYGNGRFVLVGYPATPRQTG